MSRIGLAFSSFFRLLFGKQLNPAVVKYLPPGAIPAALPAAADKPKTPDKPDKPAIKPAEPVKPAAPEPVRKVDVTGHQRDGALALLSLLQREGRLVDFLREALDGFADAEIGAAARDVHRGCKKILDQTFTLEAVMPGKEDDRVTVPKGFDPAEVRLIGEARGEPPFPGTLRHHGWRATKTQLPSLAEGVDRAVVAPAEVEV
jgi:hypothetical protein